MAVKLADPCTVGKEWRRYFHGSVKLATVALVVWSASAKAQSEGSTFNEGTRGRSVLTLSEAIERAVTVSPRVDQARAELEAQAEGTRAAWAQLGPKVSAEYNQVHFEDKQTAQLGPEEIVLRSDVAKTGSITIAQPVTGLYAMIRNANLNEMQVEAKEVDLEAARTNTAFSTAESYMQAHQAGRQLAIARASMVAAESQLHDAEALERVGRLSRGDVLKLRVALSQARARVAQSQAAMDIAFAALREALNWPEDRGFQLMEELPDIPKIELESVEAATQQALQRRSDVRQASYADDLAEYGKELAYARFAPALNVFSKWERNLGEVSGFGGGEKDSRTYGVQLSWDLWNNGARVFEVRKAMAQIEAADAAIKGVTKAVRLDVYQTIANLKAATESRELAEVAVSQAEEAYRIEKARFKAGKASATDLILAETSQATAQGQLVTAATDLLLWRLRLQKALGLSAPRL